MISGGPFLGVGTIASSGSTIVTAKTGRFRRRLAMGVIGLVLLLVGGVIGAGGVLTGGGAATGAARVAVPEAELPDLGDAGARPRRAVQATHPRPTPPP